MTASVEPPSLNSSELKPIRKKLFGLLVVNFLIYATILVPFTLHARPDTALYSVTSIAGYHIVEGVLFFGFQEYNWPCTLMFRVTWVLHDFAYFIAYAVKAADIKYYKDKYGTSYWEEACYKWHGYYCDQAYFCEHQSSYYDEKCYGYFKFYEYSRLRK